jgi:hypothetical protein
MHFHLDIYYERMKGIVQGRTLLEGMANGKKRFKSEKAGRIRLSNSIPGSQRQRLRNIVLNT